MCRTWEQLIVPSETKSTDSARESTREVLRFQIYLSMLFDLNVGPRTHVHKL